ncbi:MAG: hypothetical protein E7353_09095 [Clostridiales bacterium]|nr:hypothetical protein [Clostridiales bacterium]
MKTFQKLDRFPLGSINAEGFLKDQMALGKDGMCAHLHELEPDMINNPYINKTYVKAWGNGDQSGWGGEISGNYWTGYIQYAYTLGDEEMIKTATSWVDTMLTKQREDGYLGTYYEPDAKIYEDYNAWGTACAMRGLIAFYEATGRKDVIDAVHRCMLWFCRTWTGENKTSYAGPFIIEPMVFTYYHTGDERLIEFCEDYLEFICTHSIFETSYKEYLTKDFNYNACHSAGLGTQVRLPALVYTATGKDDYLNATVRRVNQILAKSVQPTGAPVCVSEYSGPVGEINDSEYCSFAFFNVLYSYLSFITGNAKYGDLMEQLFYNAAQGARKKDEKAIAYMSSPNQIYATDCSSHSWGDTHAYAPCFPTACCPVAAVLILPEFVRGMLLKNENDDVYVMAYGPCSLKYKDIDLAVKTYYPFKNDVTVSLNCDKCFALNLKIPAWSNGFSVTVNGEKVDLLERDGFVTVNRKWNKGDSVNIKFNAKIEVFNVDDSDGSKKYPIAVRYGALIYSYHVPEKWIPYAGHPMTPLPEGWSWYKVVGDFTEADVHDPHDQIGLRRQQIPWNFALDKDITADDFTIEELPENGYVWANPMIKLHAHCYKAPYLCAPYPCKTYEPYGDYQPITYRMPLTLVPYGCTNLRITYFPKAIIKK